jgi:hypothetical protein
VSIINSCGSGRKQMLESALREVIISNAAHLYSVIHIFIKKGCPLPHVAVVPLDNQTCSWTLTIYHGLAPARPKVANEIKKLFNEPIGR